METYDLFAMGLASLVSGYAAMKLLVRPQDRITDINSVYSTVVMTSSMMTLYMALMGHWKGAGIALLFTLLVGYLWKTQRLVTRDQFLRSMINHHSMALTMSQAQLDAPGENSAAVQALAKGIIESQEAEIRLMKTLLQTTSSTEK